MGWDTSDRHARLPAGWSTRIVPAVLRLHRGRCHVCGQQGATEVDHVIPGDDHAPANLRPIHVTCHRDKTAREARAARARIRALRLRTPEPHPLDTRTPYRP